MHLAPKFLINVRNWALKRHRHEIGRRNITEAPVEAGPVTTFGICMSALFNRPLGIPVVNTLSRCGRRLYIGVLPVVNTLMYMVREEWKGRNTAQELTSVVVVED